MFKKVSIFFGAFVVIVVVGAISSFAAGTENDPLVTLSFLNSKVSEVYAYIDSKLTGVNSGGSTSDKSYEMFRLVTVPGGTSFIAEEGTEFVLRQGVCTVIGTELGGLSNVTDGVDLQGGVLVPANSHMIVPRGDGRGFITSTDTLVLVRGAYTIK